MKVRLRPIVNNINLPTVIKTAILPGETVERLFIATQVGEILYMGDDSIRTFLDIRPQIIKLGQDGGYEERGLIGLAFHPDFNKNGLFYIHYSVAGTQGPSAIPGSFESNPCNPKSLNLKWEKREKNYDHIDTIEEWLLKPNETPRKLRTLLNLRRPFFNHNGFNSLSFSPETGKLILTVGDGGRGYDPFNLSQNDMEIFGKIIEFDLTKYPFIDDVPVVTRFNELPLSIQESLTLIAKGVRNISGITFQKFNNQYIKYIGNVGQRTVEAVYAFIHYRPIPVTEIIQASMMNSEVNQEGFINFGWRGWEGMFPTLSAIDCSEGSHLSQEIINYYDEAVKISTLRLPPLTCFLHEDPRPGKFHGTAITGVRPYMGNEIPELSGNIVFTNLAANIEEYRVPVRGTLAYTKIRTNCNLNDFEVIDIDYDFGSKSAYFVGLGTNMNQTKLYLGVYSAHSVIDFNKGTVFEIVP
jgi:hypothetical protein